MNFIVITKKSEGKGVRLPGQLKFALNIPTLSIYFSNIAFHNIFKFSFLIYNKTN